jgi:hypothetical protein
MRKQNLVSVEQKQKYGWNKKIGHRTKQDYTGTKNLGHETKDDYKHGTKVLRLPSKPWL